MFPACLNESEKVTDSQGNIPAVEDISSAQANRLIADNKENPDFVILDIRTPQEYRQGHISGSVNLDFYSPDFEHSIMNLDKDKILLIYCRSGNRSRRTLEILEGKGFSRVYHLSSGIIEWAREGLPLVR